MQNSNSIDSGYDLACSIIENFRRRLGVDVLPIFNSYALTDKEKISKASSLLIEATFLKAYEQNETWFMEDKSEFSLDAAIEIEPNMVILEKDAKIIETYKGGQVYDYVYTLTKRLEAMAEATQAEQLASLMIQGGITAIGYKLLKALAGNWTKGVSLYSALTKSIVAVGTKTVVAAAVILLVAFIFYLFKANPKKILGLVLNNTDNNLFVKDFRDPNNKGDLYMRHGVMENFMEDSEDGPSSRKVQIIKREYYGKDNEKNMVQMGVYFANRSAGLRGSEGIMVFSSMENANFKFAHMFAVPYTKDNRTNMINLSQEKYPINLDKLFQKLYDENKTRVSFVDGGYRYTSTVNDPRGGKVACIAVITQM